jgi:hypothetical protein
MRAPVGMLEGRGVIVVVIVVLRQVDVRRRQHRGKHHGRNDERRGGRPTEAGRNHAGILSGEGDEVGLSPQ